MPAPGEQCGADLRRGQRPDRIGQLSEPLPDHRGAQHAAQAGHRQRVRRSEPALDRRGKLGQLAGRPPGDLPRGVVLRRQCGEDRSELREPAAFGRMRMHVADQHVQVAPRGLDDRRVDRLGAAHPVRPAQRGADRGAADPVGTALVAE
jgi:hypothetical protein